MSWRDYEAVWKRQPPPVGAGADIAVLQETFESTHRKMAATLQVRDISEAAAGGLGAICFGFVWWQQGVQGWPIAIAIILILRVSGIYVRERLSAPHQQGSNGTTMREKVNRDLEVLQRQRQLFRDMWRWYLAPLFVAIHIVMLTIICHRPAWDPLRSLSFQLGFLFFNGLIFWFVWLINRRAVRLQVEPRIAELEKLRSVLTTPAA